MQNKGYPAQWLYELKQKNDIVSVIGKYIRLEKKGGKYWACCPFHNEKTPSFTVNEDGFFYCFGCKESGDVISFVMKYESCDFSEAVKILAKNANMEVPTFTGDKDVIEKKNKRDRILKLLDETYKHYQQNLYLPQAKPAQDYIKKRGFTGRELKDFKLGYSLNWTEMVNYLKSKGFSYQEMIDAGVVQSKNKDNYYDVMAQRLVFPIFNSFNECVGFSARALEKTDYAKYKNTAETLVFQKGKVVFGINLVKELKKQQGIDKVIIVEGQIDVIAMHRAGFKTAVACMGTALTKENAHELKKLSDKIILCFDGDGAGIKATLRSVDILKEEGFNIRIVKMPPGRDPDEILKQEGKDYLTGLIENALPVTDFLIDYEKKKFNLNKADEKGKFASACLIHINKIENESEKEPYLEKLRDLTSIPIDVLRRDINNLSHGQAEKQNEDDDDENVILSRENGNIKAVKFILASLIYNKDYIDRKIDYKKLLPRYNDVIILAEKHIPISSYFDYLNIDEMPIVKESINIDFNKYNDKKRYFEECLWLLVSQELINKQNDITEKFKKSSSYDERKEIMLSLTKITKQLKDKNMEEFYVR